DVGLRETGDHVAVALARLDVDHALPAPVRQAVLLDRRALAEAVLRHGEERRAGVRQLGPDHLVARLQSDAFHAEGRAPHRPDLLLVETDGPALAGADDPVVVAVRVPPR